MTNDILTAVVQHIMRLRQALDTLAHALSVPVQGVVSVLDAATSRFVLSQAPKALTIKAIWEDRTFTANTLLGLVAIFLVYHLRSPWRKLPPRPRGLPIIGNAFQVTNTRWLTSKDCKERFGECPLLYLSEYWAGLMAPQERSCISMQLDDPQSCSTASNQHTNSSNAVRSRTLVVPDALW
jgi:hypothetical protein